MASGVPVPAEAAASSPVGTGCACTRASDVGTKPARRTAVTRSGPYARSLRVPDTYCTDEPASRPSSSATRTPGSETWPVISTINRAANMRFHEMRTVRRRVAGPATVSIAVRATAYSGMVST